MTLSEIQILSTATRSLDFGRDVNSRTEVMTGNRVSTCFQRFNTFTPIHTHGRSLFLHLFSKLLSISYICEAFCGNFIKNRTTGPEAHLVRADRAVSRLGLNRYLWCSYTEFGQHLGVEFIGLVIYLVHTVLY